MTELEDKFCSFLLADPWFTDVLRAVRDCHLPEWAVGAGVIRNLVWDHLHGFSARTPARDVDVAFFDPTDASRERDTAIERDLQTRLPGIPWQVTNQAGVHLWYGAKFGHSISPIQSIEDAISRWPETATAVAVRLLPDGRLRVFAPCGLEDLFNLVLRRNPKQVTKEHFRRRALAKAIQNRWPKVTILWE